MSGAPKQMSKALGEQIADHPRGPGCVQQILICVYVRCNIYIYIYIYIYTMSAKVIATYSIPACKMSVACMHGRGVELIFYLGSESSSGAAKPGMHEGGPIRLRPNGAQAGSRLGPSWAQARFLEIWKSATWKSGNLRPTK